MKNRDHRQNLVHLNLDDQIRRQAYYLWQEEGCPSGHALDHWLAAEEVIRRRQGPVPRVQLRQREKVPLLNLAEMAEVI